MPEDRDVLRYLLPTPHANKHIQSSSSGVRFGPSERAFIAIRPQPGASFGDSHAPRRRVDVAIAGTRLVRVWNDRCYEVTVIAGGFEYEGRPYGSLMAIAELITGSPSPSSSARSSGSAFVTRWRPPSAKESTLARELGVDSSYVARLLRLTLLAPDIIEAILGGAEPSGLSLGKLYRAPMEREGQCQMLGSPLHR